MGRDKGAGKTQTSPLQTLMVAWTIVVGLAFAPAGAYFYQSGNLLFMIAFTGAAFVIGISLFIALALGRMGSRAKATRDDGSIANLQKRGAIFGKR